MSPANYSTETFVCLPSASDIALLDDAFAIMGEVYLAAWNVCEEIYPISSTSVGDMSPAVLDYYDAISAMDHDALFHSAVTPELRHRASELGLNIDQTFIFYVRAAVRDHGQRVTLVNHDGRPHRPWLHFGFTLPIEEVTIETTEDGVDWFRFGAIGPIAFRFSIDSVPDWVNEACLMPPENVYGSVSDWEILFTGDDTSMKSRSDALHISTESV
ncbi:MAG TPA: hypothetical protein VNE42_02595 [Acidimicrobiales bacterium]|nr:hypothetical protein [Acidimicrobiales bacterium]